LNSEALQEVGKSRGIIDESSISSWPPEHWIEALPDDKVKNLTILPRKPYSRGCAKVLGS
jgi:hypothetical protein